MIEQELLRDATRYSFLEVYKQLCDIAIENKLNPIQVIRIRPGLGLQHARTQVISVTKQENPGVDVLYFLNVNLPGLYGNSSPLPKFFTEELVQASHKDQNQARMFLDLIHQRLYQLLYDGRTQQLPYHAPTGEKNLYDFMFSMVGFKDELWLKRFPDRAFILRNINVLRHQKGTVAGLKKLMQSIFFAADITIEQCCSRQVNIARSQQLGLNAQGNQVSTNAILGNKATDIQAKIILSIMPISVEQYTKWCLTPNYWLALQNLIKYFVGQALLVDLRMSVIADKTLALNLAPKNQFALGKNTWLAHSQSNAHVVAPLTLL
jgi:type VI secretion system protein ImpH